MLAELGFLPWLALALGAFLAGLSKTAIPGVNTLAVALFAGILPAKESTGALLLLLMVGDVFAVFSYRKQAHWPTLIRLLPAVILGLIAGGFFLHLASNTGVQRSMGLLLLGLLALTLWQRRRPAPQNPGDQVKQSRAGSILFGSMSGFSSMVANAGGPVMSIYFLSARFPVHTFLGTAAWFFALVNLLKLPLLVGLGLVTTQMLSLDLLLLPAVIAGALVGRSWARHMSQKFFDRLVMAMTALGAVWLLLA